MWTTCVWYFALPRVVVLCCKSLSGRNNRIMFSNLWCGLSAVTFGRYASGISFVTLLVGFQCFHSLVFTVGNEPSVLRQGWTPLNVKGRKLGECASWGGYFWIPARQLKPLKAPETQRGKHTHSYQLRKRWKNSWSLNPCSSLQTYIPAWTH